jgi:hypothetical protein
MIRLVLTLDYELFGTGAGDVTRHMLEPTSHLLHIADDHDVPITVMAEVAEILAWENEPSWDWAVRAVEGQLMDALRTGHDVQLHLHPAWFRARHRDGRWQPDFDEYALPGLPVERIRQYIAEGVTYLNELGQRVDPQYRCTAFRAGGWLIQPSQDIVSALVKAGISIDTTVFPGGCGRTGRWELDFRGVRGRVAPWRAGLQDIAAHDPHGPLTEVPIHTRQVPLWAMLTPRRFRYQRRLLRESGCPTDADARVGRGHSLSKVRPFLPQKLDFCRLSLRELVSVVDRACKSCERSPSPVPVVAIGHSTEFNDSRTLRLFLEHLRTRRPDVSFARLGDCLS